MWGQLRIIRGDWEKFKYEGAYKISWGLEKIEGARLSGACYRGVFSKFVYNFLLTNLSRLLKVTGDSFIIHKLEYQ